METNGNMPVMMIVGCVVGAIVIAIICYYIVRAMKGSLKLELNQKSVRSGESITGNLNLAVKKSMIADRLYVGLLGEREERRRSRDGDGTTTRWIEFYRDEADILMDEELSAGFMQTYSFTLDAPSEATAMTGAAAVMKTADAMEDGAAKAIVAGLGSVAAAASGMMGGRKRWKVISRLETKGVDLAASSKINVSLKSA